MNKVHRLEYKNTLKTTSELLAKAYRVTKRRSTIQWIQNQFRIGIFCKDQYISKLKHIVNGY